MSSATSPSGSVLPTVPVNLHPLARVFENSTTTIPVGLVAQTVGPSIKIDGHLIVDGKLIISED